MKKLMTLIVSIGLILHLFACAATTKKGTLCKRAPSPGSQYCWQHGGMTKAQRAAGMTESDVAKARCKAITKSGTQCKRMSVAGKEFCWQHVNNGTVLKDDVKLGQDDAQMISPKKPIKGESKGVKNIDRVQCDALTKTGTRCTRKAQLGSSKCWQHQ